MLLASAASRKGPPALSFAQEDMTGRSPLVASSIRTAGTALPPGSSEF